MTYTIEHIAKSLKMARQKKGLSQRALSDKAGVPQGHISKIESGNVDLRLSSLVALARVLELELELIPRHAVAVVSAVVQQSEPAGRSSSQSAYSLGEDGDD